ncbi:MAG: hypothetical protein H7Y88_02855 [Phycisphaerales bacterium]|nr:hypothetical protein [Phycisphaerales bacterium]
MAIEQTHVVTGGVLPDESIEHAAQVAAWEWPQLTQTEIADAIRTGYRFDILYRGVLANTLFMAAVVATALLTWRAINGLIRLRRSRHGRCPACGYVLGPSRVCSECGQSSPVTIDYGPLEN